MARAVEFFPCDVDRAGYVAAHAIRISFAGVLFTASKVDQFECTGLQRGRLAHFVQCNPVRGVDVG